MDNIRPIDLDLVGIELLRKNNGTYIKSNLSEVMKRIFISANKEEKITEANDEYYMKSGAVPDRIYYIYSDQLNKLAKDKICDIVNFKNKPCIWFYSKNAIDMIGEQPIETVSKIYNVLLNVFINPVLYSETYIVTECMVLHAVYCIRFIKFLHETYGVLDLEDCKNKIADDILPEYTHESVLKFIDDVLDNYGDTKYFNKKIYLDSYMLLEKK